MLFRILHVVAVSGAFFSALPLAWSGTVTVPLDPSTKRPASDLVYQGRRIDESEVAQLIRGGVQTWRLSPEESLLWKNERLEISNDERQHFPADGATVRFDSYLASTKGIFRASIDSALSVSDIRPFTLSVSLSTPAALMRAAMLRRVGYQVSSPKYYRTLTVSFADVLTRDKFLDDLADRSLTSRKRWIRELPDGKPFVTLQGVVLEPGRIHVQTVHWGLMSQALQQDRRVFRALLVPDVLLDFQEKVNGYAWEVGRIFNGNIVFDYLFSDGFSDVGYEDMKWLVARLAVLSRDDWREVVSQTGLPEDVQAILTEKVISRRNAMLKLFGLAPTFPLLPFETDVNVGNISHGQLLRDDYIGYPQEFFTKPELPPLRYSQLWRYAAIEGISAGIGQLLNLVNEHLLTLQSSGGAISDHQDEVSKGMADYLFKTGSLNGYQQTTGVWAKPLAGANLNASRTVVAGTYLGSDSQVQLVDTLSVSMGAGFYLGWDGLAPLAPGVANTVTVSRSYSHVKPVKDMNTALKTNWGHLMVAGFMRKLSDSLDPNIECDIPTGPWTSEFEVDGVKFTKINYDEKRPNGKEEALALRTQLIEQGNPVDRILLQANDRESDCKGQVEKSVNKNLEGFMDGLAVGDSFIITDSIQLGNSASVSIPVTTILGADVSIAPNASHEYEIARQTMIRRVSTGFQVYIQDRRMDTSLYGVDFNFYINIMNYTRGVRHGHADTDFYSVVTDGADSSTKLKLIRSIKGLLRANNSEVLADSFEPFQLHHTLKAHLARFRFLLWSIDKQKQDHEVDIYPPLDRDGHRNAGDYKRTLAMKRNSILTGQDIFGFLLKSAGSLTHGLIGLPGVGSGNDPGNSPGGKSIQTAISTQAEITDGVAMKPVTAVEQTYRGWLLSRKDLMKIFDRFESVYGAVMGPKTQFSRGLFNRSLFDNTTTLQLYQIDSTLMFYPEALETIKSRILRDFDERGLFNHLTGLYGQSRNRIYCDIAESQFGKHGPQVFHGAGFQGCAPDWIHAIMHLRRRGFPEDKRAQLTWYNDALGLLMNNANVTLVLQSLESKDYFFVTRVNGFRKNELNGSVEYLSDTVGKYDNERGLGMYRDFSSAYGLSLFELYARFFTEDL